MPETPELSSLQTALLKHLPLLFRSLVAGLFTLLGVAGAQVLWPGTRMNRLEAEQQRMDQVHTGRIDSVARATRQTAFYTEGLAKLACRQDWDSARLVLPCGQLLGNSLPDPRSSP